MWVMSCSRSRLQSACVGTGKGSCQRPLTSRAMACTAMQPPKDSPHRNSGSWLNPSTSDRCRMLHISGTSHTVIWSSRGWLQELLDFPSGQLPRQGSGSWSKNRSKKMLPHECASHNMASSSQTELSLIILMLDARATQDAVHAMGCLISRCSSACHNTLTPIFAAVEMSVPASACGSMIPVYPAFGVEFLDSCRGS